MDLRLQLSAVDLELAEAGFDPNRGFVRFMEWVISTAGTCEEEVRNDQLALPLQVFLKHALIEETEITRPTYWALIRQAIAALLCQDPEGLYLGTAQLAKFSLSAKLFKEIQFRLSSRDVSHTLREELQTWLLLAMASRNPTLLHCVKGMLAELNERVDSKALAAKIPIGELQSVPAKNPIGEMSRCGESAILGLQILASEGGVSSVESYKNRMRLIGAVDSLACCDEPSMAYLAAVELSQRAIDAPTVKLREESLRFLLRAGREKRREREIGNSLSEGMAKNQRWKQYFEDFRELERMTLEAVVNIDRTHGEMVAAQITEIMQTEIPRKRSPYPDHYTLYEQIHTKRMMRAGNRPWKAMKLK